MLHASMKRDAWNVHASRFMLRVCQSYGLILIGLFSRCHIGAPRHWSGLEQE